MSNTNNGRRSISTLSVLTIIIFSFLSMTLLTGCGGSPVKTVENYANAIKDGEWSKSTSYCTERMINIFEDMEEVSGESPEDMDIGEAGELGDLKKLTSSVDGSTARVWLPDLADFVYILVKQGGGWKIDDFEIDGESFCDSWQEMKEMMQQMESMMPEGVEMPEGLDMPGSSGSD